jgi:ferric enterobactin receptor
LIDLIKFQKSRNSKTTKSYGINNIQVTIVSCANSILRPFYLTGEYKQPKRFLLMQLNTIPRYIILFFFVICCSKIYGQRTGNQIMGTLIDSFNRKPVENVAVSLIGQSLSKKTHRAVTDTNGLFRITDLTNGIYSIHFERIGYQPQKTDSIIIKDSNTIIQIGSIALLSSTQTLSSVIVSSKSAIIENKIDKIVYNAANDISSQGGTAIDLLKKTPQVTVDVDGNVDVLGNSNIRFLINGKPSSIFGNNAADALASIPASSIKSIEVITNPGSKYDAQGTGGVINIILKDNKVQGINGSIALSAGTRLENGSFNLNLRHNNFGATFFFSGNAQLSSRTPSTQDRLSTDSIDKTTTHLLQDGYTDLERSSYQSGIGFDWKIDAKNSITGSFSYSHFEIHNNGLVNVEQITKDSNANLLSDVYNFRNSDSRTGIHSIDYSIDYKKNFHKEGEELELLYNASNGTPYNNYLQTQTFKGQTNPYLGSSGNDPGTDNSNNISIDYSLPVNKNFLFEAGAKASFQNITSIAGVGTLDTTAHKYMSDSTQSYTLNYTINIYAGYISASFPLFGYLDVKTGVRYEYTNATISFPNTSIPSYGSVVPSLTLSHSFNKNNFIKIAYSHRIERPDYNALNPFVNLSDPYNITMGNPSLQPEIGNNIELGFSKTFTNKATIYMALIERINSQDIKPYTLFYPAYMVGDSVYKDVSVLTRRNVGTEYNSGIIASISIPVKDKLNLRSNIQFAQQQSVNDYQQGNITIGYRFRMNLNATYQFPHDLALELFGNYNSATTSVQGRVPQSGTYTFAFRKQLWNKKASVGFTATNLFNKYIEQVTTLTATNYSSYNTRFVPYRSFGLSFTYKFGKLTFKKTKENENDYLNDLPN